MSLDSLAVGFMKHIQHGGAHQFLDAVPQLFGAERIDR